MNKIKYITFIIILFINLLYSTITYVTVEGAGSQDGTTWDNAMPGDSLQVAITNSNEGDQVWVAKGTYKPNSWPTYSSDFERDKHFSLTYGLYGGFAGTEIDISQREIKNNETILSGDIGVVGDIADNCFHVINNDFVSPDFTIIDGFIIEYGNTNDTCGGGMVNDYAAPLIRNCTFRFNTTKQGGGAIANLLNELTGIVIENCLFYGNNAEKGGAVYSECASTIITNCTFVNNTASDEGSAIYFAPSGYYMDGYQIGINEITNNIVWGNSGNSQIFRNNADFVKLYFNAIEDGYEGFGNISLSPNNEGDTNSPYFTDPDNNNWELQVSSPCLDSGVYWNALETDIYLEPRPQGLNYDMGAYEFESVEPNALLPTISTLSAENISATYATLGGNITDDGGTQLIAKGIKYSTSSGFDPNTEGTLVRLLELMDEGKFEIFVTNLSPNTRYYYRAYCESKFGYVYADEVQRFMTADSLIINPDANGIVYVKEDGVGDGSSWDDALNGNELQNGIDHIDTEEIWVAKGIYKPISWPWVNVINGTTEREKHFSLRHGKMLYGGFEGNETSIGQRNIKTNETILSGDIGVEGYYRDNCYHVMYNFIGRDSDGELVYIDTTDVIDGFTIQDGYADATIREYSFFGGGIHNRHSYPKINNCLIKNNYAIYGGGICNEFTDVGHVQIINTIITHNQVKRRGGGIVNAAAYPIIKNCLITQNTAGEEGGGLYHWTEYNEFFTSDTLKIHNTTIVDNNAPSGSGIYIKSDCMTGDNVEIIQNSVIWGESPVFTFEYEDTYGSIQTIDHCAITGGYFGEGNITISTNNAGDPNSPYFSDPDNGNYMIQEYSPLRNAGIWNDDVPLYDLYGFTRDSLPDIGCYEYDESSIDDSGQRTVTSCQLYQNYPNPFNPSTNITFTIPKKENVKLLLYNVAGQLVKTIINEELKAGNHRILFEASDLNSGMYYYTLKTENTKISKKMLLLK